MKRVPWCVFRGPLRNTKHAPRTTVDRWLVRALRRRYVRASMPALRAIVECYRQGMVVAGEGTWRPEDHEGSMECLIRGLLTWADGKRAWGSDVCDLTNGPSNIQW